MAAGCRLSALGGVLLLAGMACAAGQNPGAVFLEIWPGARPTALGGAFAATADDASATYYNRADWRSSMQLRDPDALQLAARTVSGHVL